MYFPPKLGVGITYFPQINNFIKEHNNLIKVIEIEPQTHWYEVDTSPSKYKINFDILKRIKKLPQRKIVHSVATPVGGKRSLKPPQFSLIKLTIDELDALWFSEHLSFNSYLLKEKEFKTSFFLCPIQTYEGIKDSVESIKVISSEIKIPFAIENGVNYLRPRKEEILDGDFIGSIIDRANCGIVLDLHNLWTNQVNGRQSINAFLKGICRERVWEIHLAGGNEEHGYYVDAHAGGIPKELINITKEIINYFPNLSTLIFEMTPSYLQKIDNDVNFIKEQLNILHNIWRLRNDDGYNNRSDCCVSKKTDVFFTGYNPKPSRWETLLGSLVLGLDIDCVLESEKKVMEYLIRDPAINLINKIIFETRASALVTTMFFTCRLLFICLGIKGFNNLIKRFFREYTPSLFANKEGKNFYQFLEHYKSIELLNETLLVDMSILNYNINKTPQYVVMSKDPLILLNDLLQYKLPSQISEGVFQIEIGENGMIML